MSKEQANLKPSEQNALFELLKRSGSQPTSGGQSTDIPDSQQGLDVEALRSQLQQQEGDKMHPADAIAQILGPQKPNGIEYAGGMQLSRNKAGDMTAQVPASQPLLKLFGVKESVPINSPNYFDTIQKLGLTEYLPHNLARTPEGTPFVGQNTFTELTKAKSMLPSSNNPPITLQSALDNGIINQETYDKLISNGSKPDTVQNLNVWRLGVLGRTASTREAQVGVAKNKLESTLGMHMQKDIADAEASPNSQLGIASNILSQAALLRNSLINRRYDPEKDTYDFNPTEYGELAMGAARILTRKGAMTDEQLNQVKQDTGMDRLARIAGFVGLNSQAAPDDIGRRLVALVDNEGLAAANMRDLYVSQKMPAYAALKKMNAPYYTEILNKSYGGVDYAQLLADSKDTQSDKYQMPNVVPLVRTPAPGQSAAPNYPSSVPGVGNPLPQQTPRPNVRPRPISKPTGAWKVIR